MLALLLLVQSAGPTVGDTLWVTQEVQIPRGMSVRPRPVTATQAFEPLGPPEVVAQERQVTIRYPLVMWQPGRHTIELPGAILVRADGWSDTLAPAVATIEVRSVLPGPPSDTIPPKPPQEAVPRTTPALLPVLFLVLLTLLLLVPLHWWWRKRGRGLRTEKREPHPTPRTAAIDPGVLAAWSDSGELRMAAEGWAGYLSQRLVVRDDPELARLVARLRAARFSPNGEHDLAGLLAEASRMVHDERSGPAPGSRLPAPGQGLSS